MVAPLNLPGLLLPRLELGQIELLQLLLENLARFKLHDRTLRNNDFGFRLVWIPADALFAHLNFEYAKIAQLNIPTVS